MISSPFFVSNCWDIFSQNTLKYLKQFSTEDYEWRHVIIQNFLIPRMLLMFLDQNISFCKWYILRALGDFNRENYTWRLVIVQNLYEFWQFSCLTFYAEMC